MPKPLYIVDLSLDGSYRMSTRDVTIEEASDTETWPDDGTSGGSDTSGANDADTLKGTSTGLATISGVASLRLIGRGRGDGIGSASGSLTKTDGTVTAPPPYGFWQQMLYVSSHLFPYWTIIGVEGAWRGDDRGSYTWEDQVTIFGRSTSVTALSIYVENINEIEFHVGVGLAIEGFAADLKVEASNTTPQGYATGLINIGPLDRVCWYVDGFQGAQAGLKLFVTFAYA